MGSYDSFIHMPLEGIDREKYILALYSYQTASSDALKLAEALVVEQTTGTWTAVPEETREVKERSAGRVIGVYETPHHERVLPAGPSGSGPNAERSFLIYAAYPVGNINGQFPELLTTLYGNISMIGKLKLLDVFFPPAFLKSFKGPKFGVEGIRRILGIKERPLLCGMYKPCVGALPKVLGGMAYDMARGGVDVIKDDELLADPEFCPVAARVEESEKALSRLRKETGTKALYTVNVTDRPDRMHEKARAAVTAGVSGIMVNLFTVGYAACQELAEDSEITVPIMGHPAFAGTFFESPDHGLASHLVLGKLARLAGVDMIIYPSPYGKVPLLRERAIRIAQELTAPIDGLRRVFPGPAAGMHPGTVARSISDFGLDMLVGAGGGIHGHPQGTVAGGRAFHQAIEAAMRGIPAAQAAKGHPELREALELWGDEPSPNYALLR